MILFFKIYVYFPFELMYSEDNQPYISSKTTLKIISAKEGIIIKNNIKQFVTREEMIKSSNREYMSKSCIVDSTLFCPLLMLFLLLLLIIY